MSVLQLLFRPAWIVSALFLMSSAAAVITETARAQAPVQFGIKAGMNSSSFKGADFEADPNRGFYFGGSVDIGLPYVPGRDVVTGIETGLFYSQKGVYHPSFDPDTKFISVDYIQIPALAKLTYHFSGELHPYAVAGPQIGFAVNSEAQTQDDDITDLDDHMNSAEIGGIIGAGADLNTGFVWLNFQIRYDHSFTKTFKKEYAGDIKNGVFSIVFGIRF